jgi:hypothetical protein
MMLGRRWEWRGSRGKGKMMDRIKSSGFCCFAYIKELDGKHRMNENGNKPRQKYNYRSDYLTKVLQMKLHFSRYVSTSTLSSP